MTRKDPLKESQLQVVISLLRFAPFSEYSQNDVPFDRRQKRPYLRDHLFFSRWGKLYLLVNDKEN